MSVGLLAASLEGLLGEDLGSFADAELAERARVLLRATDQVSALLSTTIREVESRGLAGCPMNPWGRTEAWLATLESARHGRGELVRHVTRARGAALVPLVAGLHAGGEVSTSFLDAARAGARQLPAEARAGWDALLAGEARDTLPTEIPTLLAHVLAMIDPDGVSEKAARAQERSELYVSPYGSDGAWAIKGTLHGLEGELFSTLINHYARPRDAEDRRGAAERRAAALCQILRIAQRATDDPDYRPAPRGQDAHLVVLVGESSWHSHAGSPAATTPRGTVVDPGQLAALRCQNPTPDILVTGDSSPGDSSPGDADAHHTGPDHDSPRQDGRPYDGRPGTVDASLSAAAVETAQLRRLMTGLVGFPAGARVEPLAYGRGLRRASRAQWLALIARDRHCVGENCARDPSWCEGHHCREWDADGGLTDLEQLALLCWEHHTALHRAGLHLHPPWCHCPDCLREHPTTWTTRKHPPEFTSTKTRRTA